MKLVVCIDCFVIDCDNIWIYKIRGVVVVDGEVVDMCN